MRLPNVAFLLDSAPRTWSSQEDRHLAICQALAVRGSRSVLVFASELPGHIRARFEEGGVSIATINYSTGPRNFYRELSTVVKEHSVDCAHIIFFDYFRAVFWLTRFSGVKNIIYEMQNGGVFKATSWKRQLIHARNRLMTAPMVRIVAISNYIKAQLVAGGVPSEKIVVRHLGIDIDRFQPDAGARERLVQQYGIGPDETILSTVSYLRPIKSPEIIVQACGLLKQRGVPVRLFVGGDGEMLDELKQLSVRLGIEDRTHWLGLVADPRELLQASDIFLLATVGEAFGLVLAESMACGVPVVGSRAGAIPEVVLDGETGLLVNPRDAASMADGIQRLAENRALHRCMSQKSIARVRDNFTLDKAVDETLAVYEALP